VNGLRGMLFQLVKSLGQAFGIVVLVFLLVRVVPGDAVDALGLQGGLSAEQQAAMRTELGLDRPLPVQFVDWVGKAATGDFGQSLRFHRPVADMIRDALPITLIFGGLSFLVGIVLAFGVALLAVMTRSRFFVFMVDFLNVWSIALPTFCVGVILILVFSIWLRWLPVLGVLSMPAFVIGMDNAGQIVKALYEELDEASTAAHVRTARAKGLGALRIAFFHLLPTAVPVALALSGLILAGLVSGALTMEVLFGLPGIGSLTLKAIQGRDYPLVQAAMVVIALGLVAVNTLTDLLHRLIDPRLSR